MRNCGIVLLSMLCAGGAVAQPTVLSASSAVLWLDGINTASDAWRPGGLDAAPGTLGARDALPLPAVERRTSLGSAHEPVLVVIWRGQPGWMFREDRPAQRVAFFGEFSPTGVRSTGTVQGGISLEIAYDSGTGAAQVNGARVPLPEGHNVILVDKVDGDEHIAETLRIEGRDREWIETFLGRSEAVREFVRCETPLPPDVFAGNTRFRRGMQRSLDERCQLLLNGASSRDAPLESQPR